MRVKDWIRPRTTDRKSVVFEQSFARFQTLAKSAGARMPVRWRDRHPCQDDATHTTEFDRHYVFHTAWAARVLAETEPDEHVDIGSYIYFAAMISAFVPTHFYDFRPAPMRLDNLCCDRADLTQLSWPDQCVASLSCMHVVEHIGLGRYGDPLAPEGDRKAMRELARVLAPGGNLLFVVPVGRPRVCFNAHRIYGFNQIVEEFAGLELRQFALIPDRAKDGDLMIDADPALVARQSYACGCFWFRK